jgi:hypothetical protein
MPRHGGRAGGFFRPGTTPRDIGSADERKRRIAELEVALDQAERAEQTLLHQAHEAGLDILPRADSAAAAYLGVVVVNGMKAAA